MAILYSMLWLSVLDFESYYRNTYNLDARSTSYLYMTANTSTIQRLAYGVNLSPTFSRRTECLL